MTAIRPDTADGAPWNILLGGGPVLATSIHAGHHVRYELQPWLEIEEDQRLREEDPMTDYFLTVADNCVRANRSRFEFDLNRPRKGAISPDPDDTWGLKIWREDLPQQQIDASRALHHQFFEEAKALCDKLVEQHGHILVLDLHSYNHMRDGPDGEPAAMPDNPDIDIGATTVDKDKYGDLLDAFMTRLRATDIRGRTPDVRENQRFPDGGYFPEWLYDIYGEKACIITLEYKKIFMDEWGTTTDILALQHLRTGLMNAVSEARHHLDRINDLPC